MAQNIITQGPKEKKTLKWTSLRVGLNQTGPILFLVLTKYRMRCIFTYVFKIIS